MDRYRFKHIQTDMKPATVFLIWSMSPHLRVNRSPFCWETLNLTIQTMQATKIGRGAPWRTSPKRSTLSLLRLQRLEAPRIKRTSARLRKNNWRVAPSSKRYPLASQTVLRQFDRWIDAHKKDLVDLTCRLVSIDTTVPPGLNYTKISQVLARVSKTWMLCKMPQGSFLVPAPHHLKYDSFPN